LKITVVGTGYVGLVTGACFASTGNEVTCVDTDENKVAALTRGEIPIHEPGLDGLVTAAVANQKLKFTTSLAEALQHPQDCVFIAVGTPPGENGSADLSHVLAVAREIGKTLTYPTVVVDKSTVPVGTADAVRAALAEAMQDRGTLVEFSVVSNPEFLKEGAAIKDFMEPARVVVGTDSEKAAEVMKALYAPFTRSRERLILMNVRDAEMTKYAANAMLATRISFMNELAVLCDKLGVDVERVRAGMGSDPRIGNQFLYPGVGYGGSCFPKDVKALVKTGKDNGVTLGILEAVEERNNSQKHYIFNKIIKEFGSDLSGLTFSLWGLAFKAGTDDMREAPALTLIEDLLASGAKVKAYDPVALNTAQKACKEMGLALENITFVKSAKDALVGTTALIVITDWMEFRSPDFKVIAKALATPIIFDGRNMYSKPEVNLCGLRYVGVGR